MKYIEEIYSIIYTIYMCLLCESYYKYTHHIHIPMHELLHHICMSYYTTCIYIPTYVS